MTWQVYILRCNDGSLYTGITSDVERRLQEHNFDSKKAARYTRARRPVTLLHVQTCESRREAAQLEYQLKKLTRQQKLAWLEQHNNTVKHHA